VEAVDRVSWRKVASKAPTSRVPPGEGEVGGVVDLVVGAEIEGVAGVDRDAGDVGERKRRRRAW